MMNAKSVAYPHTIYAFHLLFMLFGGLAFGSLIAVSFALTTQPTIALNNGAIIISIISATLLSISVYGVWATAQQLKEFG